MSPLACLVAYLTVVFAGAALLAPPFYWLAQAMAQQFAPFHWLAEHPFHRYVNRCLLGLALLGLYPFLRGVNLHAWTKLGLTWPIQWQRMGTTSALGIASVAVLALPSMALGTRQLTHHRGLADFGLILAEAALSGMAVGVLEETLFRGALFGALRKACRWPAAWGLSGLLYALVHFLQKPPAPLKIYWFSGFTTLAAMLTGLAQWSSVLPELLNLMIIGLLLALAYQRTGNLYFSIGLHAGWVFALRTYLLLTEYHAGTTLRAWTGYELADGWLAFLALLGALALVWRFAWKQHATASPPAV